MVVLIHSPIASSAARERGPGLPAVIHIEITAQYAMDFHHFLPHFD
jgi:hypothetical protein